MSEHMSERQTMSQAGGGGRIIYSVWGPIVSVTNCPLNTVRLPLSTALKWASINYERLFCCHNASILNHSRKKTCATRTNIHEHTFKLLTGLVAIEHCQFSCRCCSCCPCRCCCCLWSCHNAIFYSCGFSRHPVLLALRFNNSIAS